MSTVAEIEAAIKALSLRKRERLAENLPSILPELNGGLKWQRIISDAAPRPALTALGDEIAEQFKTMLPAGRDPQTRRSEPVSSARSSGEGKGHGED
jgi:hypothetical protein